MTDRPDDLRHRTSLLGILRGLMVADNLGDVHNEIEFLCDLIGLPRPEGNFIDGWTNKDMAMTQAPGEHDDQE